MTMGNPQKSEQPAISSGMSSTGDENTQLAESNILNNGLPTTDGSLDSGLTEHQITNFQTENPGLAQQYENKNDTIIPVADISIKDILARPYLVVSGDWKTSDAFGTTLFSKDTFVGGTSILQSNAIWADKIKGFAFVRGTLCVKILLNGSPFHCGALRIALSPCAFNIGYRGKTVPANSMLPSVLVNVQDSNASIKLPYIARSSWCDLKNQLDDLGEIKIMVEAPLKVGSGTTTITYDLYCWFEDFEMSGPFYPQMGTRKVVTSKNVAAEKGYSGSYITSLTTPILDKLYEGADFLSNTLDGALNLFGFSKTSLENSQVVSRLKIPFFSHGEGTDTATPLSLLMKNGVALSSSLAPTSVDEMSFDYIKKYPMWTNAFQWSTASVAGTKLFEVGVSPVFCSASYNTVFGTRTVTGNIFAPFAHIANLFRFWRGDIIYTFRIFKTPFHAGRLQFVYTPKYVGSDPDLSQSSQYSIREVVDLADRYEVSLRIPFQWQYTWAKTTDVIGRLQVYVHNVLVVPTTASSTIDIAIYTCAADNFEVGGPYVVSNAAYFPQMDYEKPILKEAPINNTIGNYNSPDVGMTPMQQSMGEAFTSLRQLMQRYTDFNKLTTTTAGAGCALSINPFTTSYYTAGPTNGTPPTACNMLHSYLASGYIFYRGSMRVAIVNTNSTDALSPIRAGLIKQSAPVSTSLDGAVVNYNISTSATAVPTVAPNSSHIIESTLGMLEVRVPFYTEAKAEYVQYKNTQGATKNIAPDVGVYTTINSASTNVPNIYTAIGEDFQLSYFVGFLPVISSIS